LLILAIRIESLGKHVRTAFSCGQTDLDDWFRHRASQDEKRNISRVFVAVDDVLGIVGFYSLSSFKLALEDLPETVARKLPRYADIPAALIGRLARDSRARGTGLGNILLADAVRRILSAGRSMAVFAIVVDAKDDHAIAFYQGFGFSPFPTRPRRLFLLASVAAQAFADATE
jgi:ribosomal protein S18 acetylase RimI-like enzyme